MDSKIFYLEHKEIDSRVIYDQRVEESNIDKSKVVPWF